jgi:hypothetical protein
MPIVGIFISIGMILPMRWLDSGFPCCKEGLEVNEDMEAKLRD